MARQRTTYACGPCRAHKVRCSHEVPCGRCVRYGRADQCLAEPATPPPDQRPHGTSVFAGSSADAGVHAALAEVVARLERLENAPAVAVNPSLVGLLNRGARQVVVEADGDAYAVAVRFETVAVPPTLSPLLELPPFRTPLLAYLNTLHPLTRTLHAPTFLRSLEKLSFKVLGAHAGETVEPDYDFLALVYLLMAVLAAQASGSMPHDLWARLRDCYQRALDAGPSVTLVVYAVVLHRFQHWCPHVLWLLVRLLVGSAVAAAHLLGFHCERVDTNTSLLQLEIQRRVWWDLVGIDCWEATAPLAPPCVVTPTMPRPLLSVLEDLLTELSALVGTLATASDMYLAVETYAGGPLVYAVAGYAGFCQQLWGRVRTWGIDRGVFGGCSGHDLARFEGVLEDVETGWMAAGDAVTLAQTHMAAAALAGVRMRAYAANSWLGEAAGKALAAARAGLALYTRFRELAPAVRYPELHYAAAKDTVAAAVWAGVVAELGLAMSLDVTACCDTLLSLPYDLEYLAQLCTLLQTGRVERPWDVAAISRLVFLLPASTAALLQQLEAAAAAAVP